MCKNGYVESDSVLAEKGVNTQGYKEIFGVDVASGEEEATWEVVFADLPANEVCRNGDWILDPFV